MNALPKIVMLTITKETIVFKFPLFHSEMLVEAADSNID